MGNHGVCIHGRHIGSACDQCAARNGPGAWTIHAVHADSIPLRADVERLTADRARLLDLLGDLYESCGPGNLPVGAWERVAAELKAAGRDVA